MAVAPLPDPATLPPLYDVVSRKFDGARLRQAMLVRGLMPRDFVGPDKLRSWTTIYRALRGDSVGGDTAIVIYRILDDHEPMAVALRG